MSASSLRSVLAAATGGFVWWASGDGLVKQLTEAEAEAWLDKGVSSGVVVFAGDGAAASRKGRRWFERCAELGVEAR